MGGKPTMSQSTANSRKMEEENCVYRCSRGLLASDEVTSCRLGQIRMVPLPETWENIIPAISRRSVRKHQLHCGWRVLVQNQHRNKAAALPHKPGQRARAAWSAASAAAAGVLMSVRCEYLIAWIRFDCEGCCGL